MQNLLPEKVMWVWDARWGSYWFSDEELFRFKDKDFDRKAEALAKTGINAVITFGGFHFRWIFVDDWPQLLLLLKKICKSCHSHGIKVVEHHSASGVFHPQGAKEWEHILSSVRQDEIELDRHPGFLQILNDGDKEYKGVKFSSMRQIDPRTGLFARGGYLAFPLCHNNPDWQRLYFEHLKDIYACDVDGIMTDDVGFWVRDYSCACLHCREKFKKDTGYEMPPAGLDDKEFYGNLENRSYQAWVLWRIECHKEHQERVFTHFRGLGLELARPIYNSSNTNSYASRGMGVSLDNLEGYYSTVFTEVNAVEPQAHCWLRIGAESKQRNALASRAGVPPMCLFYPHNKEENLFCWAMTKSWGQRYWATNWKQNLSEEAEMLRQAFNFESSYPQLYTRPETLAEVGVLYSAHTVWLHSDNDEGPDCIRMSDPASTDCWAGWCEMLMLANIPFDVIVEKDLEEGRGFERLRLIILPNTVCLSDKQIDALKMFVRNGGRVIISHQSGMKDDTGAWREEYPLSEMIGADYDKTLDSSPEWTTTDDCKLDIKGCRHTGAPVVHFVPDHDTAIWMELKGDSRPAVFYHKFGKGSVITFAGKPGRLVCVNRHERFEMDGKTFARIDFDQDQDIMALMEKSVRFLLQPGAQLETEGVPRGFVIGLFGHGGRTVLHVVNAAGVLGDSGREIPVHAPLGFPGADSLPGGAKVMTLKVNRESSEAVLRSPEFSDEKELVCRREGTYTVIELPADLVNCYSAIELK